jgi:NADPH-dependent 2,4-dienoyl-CoA reductase/sulfur reductase-like enzyme
VRDALAAVHPGAHEVLTQDGRTLAYDHLLLALGARPRRSIEGALTFRGPQDAPRIAAGLRELGTRSRVAFAVPPVPAWTLLPRALPGRRGPGGRGRRGRRHRPVTNLTRPPKPRHSAADRPAACARAEIL